jgi:hypothetical protein
MRSKLIVLIVFFATAAAVAGCGGDSSNGDQGSDATGAQVNQPPMESPSKPPKPQAGEMSDPQRNLESSGYSVSVLSGPHDLENVAKGVTIVASTGISVSGKGVHRAIGYAFASPAEASALQKSIPGLASSLNANRLYFVGEREPNAPFDRMVQVAEG